MKKLIGFIFLLVAGLFPAIAATITVSTTSDVVDGTTTSISALMSSPGADTKISLREAVIAVNNTGTGNTIVIPAGTYLLTMAGASENNSSTGDLDFRASNTTVTGAGSASTIIQQTITDRVIEANPVFGAGFNFTISGVTITAGNVTSIGGGGMLAGSSGGLTTVTDCIFSNNQSSSAAGGLGHDAGSLSMTSCTFNNNVAPAAGGNGGAVRFIASGADTLTVNTCTFVNNSASSTTSGGGALSLSGTSATYNISKSYFGGNKAPGSTGKGGAIYVASGTMNVSACGFATNQIAGASGFAGAIYVNGGTTTITYSRFIANSAATAANGLALFRNTANVGTLTANDNWWGSNTGPAVNTVLNGTVSTYLQLRHTASPTTIAANGTSTLSATIFGRSDGSTISSANFIGLPSFPSPAATIFSSPVLGTLSAAGTQLVNGSATATFTAGSTKGSASANATADGQSVTANLTVEAPAVVTNVTSTVLNGSYRAGQLIPITVMFDQVVTVVGTPQLTLETGASDAVLNYASGTGSQTLTFNYTVAAGHTSSDLEASALTANGGTIRSGTLQVNASLTLPSSGATGSLSANKSIVIDTTAPTVSIGAPSVTATNGGSVTYTVTYSGADSVTLANGNVSVNATGNATATPSVSGSGTTTRTVTLSGISGNGTLAISVVAGTASDLAGNTAAAAGPSTAFSVDTTAPTVSIGPPSVSITNGGSVTYTVTYTGADTVTLANANITVNPTGNATATPAVSGSGTATRTVTLSGISGNGTLGISVAGATARDNAGNAAAAAGPSTAFTVDTTAPTLLISAPSVSITNGGGVTYTVTYTGADTVTLTNANITVNPTGNATATASVSGSGTTTRTVTLSGISGNGTLGITIAAATARDNAGNTAANAGPSATFEVDTIAPLVSISAPSVSSTNGGSVTYTVTYTDADSITLSNANVTINATGSAAASASVSGSGVTTRTVTLSGITGTGTLGISLASATARDQAGNNAPAAGPSSTVQIVNTNANLAALVLSAGAFTPTFSASTTNYTANVGTNVTTTTVTPTVADVAATVLVRVNGGAFGPVSSGTPSSSLSLNPGTNSIDVKVIAQDSTTEKIYTISVVRAVEQPTILSITIQSVDTYRLQFLGSAGINYTLLMSTNLSGWDPLTNLTATGNGTFEFTHSYATNYPRLYYRLRYP
jgi:hypothetical protein